MAPSLPQVIRNFYTFQTDVPLKDGSSGSTFGRSITQYEIRRRRDVQNLGSSHSYTVMMTQRIIIPSTLGYRPGPTSSSAYDNYPAILVNELDITANNNAKIVLQNMFPKTLNSQVSTSRSSDSSSQTGMTQQNTSGSSDTNVNTFGVGISAGIFGELPVVNLSTNYSHSWEHSHSHSSSEGHSQGDSHSTGAAASMSIKDWSSYGYLNNEAIAPSWVWGQSYPWDVIQYNQSSNGTDIDLPKFVSDRMLSGSLVLPPSQLSLFGLDFTMTAGWIIDFPEGVSEDETVTISHTTSSYSASHQKNGGALVATLQNGQEANVSTYSSDAIDLSRYALTPIAGPGSDNGAAIGFTAHSFTYPPTAPKTPFKIVSPAGNLQVTGTGFDDIMTTSFKEKPKLTITFKIADTDNPYALLLMHWIGQKSGACELHWTVNGTWSGAILVNEAEGTGGQNNVSTIDLRNLEFTSINFHDYLVVGTNTVEIDIIKVDASAPTSYTLFATAIGEV
ncbi:hypothetical protein [Halomonas llamarensis]|uniref:Uncharacterized protein n=1 Tax=Halomonas llamarensis TaxID=2945104 RepID=A0ABT0SL50_9GAMM|nr:hypothetical protein [Halomonas llamarensis]MCL7928526.1 hypothetical protein [Halomonas llamarensis]